MWHEAGHWETAEEKAERLANEPEPEDEGQKFMREQMVSAKQQMGLPDTVGVGRIVDASQLAPSEWPGEVIDLRTKR